jgi:hypothetical protein
MYPILKASLRANYADLARMEEVLRDSDLDWTIVRPPRLTGKPLTGTYRTAYGQNIRTACSSRAPTWPTTCSVPWRRPRPSGRP